MDNTKVIDNGSACENDTGTAEYVPSMTSSYMKEAHDKIKRHLSPSKGRYLVSSTNASFDEPITVPEAREQEILLKHEEQKQSATDDGPSNGASEGWVRSGYIILKEEIVHLKWRMLVLCCCVPIGNYYIYDFPSALGVGKDATIQSRFFDQDEVYTQKMNQALYSVYSYPNVLLCIFGGILIDSVLGIRLSMLLFSSCVLIGSFVFYLGVQVISYELIMIGRFIFSLGGESLWVAQYSYIAILFKGGRGMTFAYALSLSCLRLGSSASFYFSPIFAEKYGVAFATLVGTFMCGFSTCCCVGVVFLDRYAIRRKIIEPQELCDTKIDEITGEKIRIPFSERVKTAFFQLRTLPLQYWLLCCVCMFLYGSNFPFVGFAKNFFQIKYSLSAEDGGRAVSIYEITAVIFTPVLGIICDNTGRSSYILIIASVSFVLIHLIMIVTYISPIAAMVLNGIFYSFLAASLWPAIVYLVSQRVIGISYGVMASVQNIGSATVPLFVGAILDANLEEENGDNIATNSSLPSGPAQPTLTGYYYVEGLMIAFAVVSLIFGIILIMVDTKMSGGIISVGANKRDHIMRLRIQHPDKHMNCNEFHRANNNTIISHNEREMEEVNIRGKIEKKYREVF